jgi:hypothetical protein
LFFFLFHLHGYTNKFFPSPDPTAAIPDPQMAVEGQILFHARSYQRAWGALRSVGTPEDLLVYHKLEEKDLVVVKDITMAKRYGQGSETLAWFWRIGPSKDSMTKEWMEESA